MRALVLGVAAGWLAVAPAWAQEAQQEAAGSGGQAVAVSSEEGYRPATTTWFGDTGLWFVPTGEILPAGKFSVSGYRVNFDREQGFSDFSLWPITFGYGLGDRAELFGSFRVVNRIDRDRRPIFEDALESSGGGLYYEYPTMAEGWNGNAVSDFLVGAKINLLSEYRQHPAAMAIRAAVKLPTGDDKKGASTGKADFLVDAIVSKEISQKVELAGFGGIIIRGDPTDIDIPHGFRWGVGFGAPARGAIRFTGELHGELPFDTVVTNVSDLVGDDGSQSPISSPFKAPVDLDIGLTYQHRSGFFLGAGMSWSPRTDARANYGDYGNVGGDNLGFQARLGYHPGVRIYVPPPPPPPPPPAAPENRPPTVKARCNPCTVEINRTSTVTGDASDPDGDPLTYKWTAPAGSFANPSERETVWTAPSQPGPVPVTITVDDGKSGTASDSVTIQVVRPPVKEYTFEDVHFDFDRYSLRPDAARVLDEAVKAMQDDATLRLEVEGHTCSIGTAEYNLALGERRASAVRDYLASRGIGADRLTTISYGEERPKHDNAREETRRLNRRAALVVRLQR